MGGWNFQYHICVGEIVAKGLGCNAREDEVAFIVAIVVFSFGCCILNFSAFVHFVSRKLDRCKVSV